MGSVGLYLNNCQRLLVLVDLLAALSFWLFSYFRGKYDCIMTSTTISKYDPIKYKTPTGSQLTCKGWLQEAALRMLLNNLDPQVAERPDDLIVYGGRGKAARNFEALD